MSITRARVAVHLLFLLNGLIGASWVSRIPDMKQTLAVGEGTLGFALFSAAVGALVAQPLAGGLVNRFGSRRVTLWLSLWACAAVALLGQATTLPVFMFTLALHGAGIGGMDVAMNVQAAGVEQRAGRPIMTAFHGVWSVGSLLGALAGGQVAGAGIGLALHLPAAGALSVPFVLLAVSQLLRQDTLAQNHAPGPRPQLRGALLGMGVMAFCVLCAEGAVADWSTLFMRETLGEPAARATLAYGLFSGVMAIGRFGGDALVQRFGATRIVQASAALIVLGTLLVLAAPSALPALAGFVVIGAGLSCVFPQILSLAAKLPGLSAGTGIAAMATAGYTGFLVGPPLIGLTAELSSLRAALGLIAVFGVLTLAIALRRDPARA